MNIIIGKTVIDKLTGFKGLATAYCEYISGCNQVLITPKVEADGKMVESHWVDEQRLEAQKGKDKVSLDNGDNPGFGKEAPKI